MSYDQLLDELMATYPHLTIEQAEEVLILEQGLYPCHIEGKDTWNS